MRNIILISVAALLIILPSLVTYANAASGQKHSFIENSYSFLSQDNRAIKFLAAYSENSTDYTEVFLMEPKTQITKRDVTFVCEARGTKPARINLYTDTSGEWKLRSSIEIRPGKSPYRVKFTEESVPDGAYNWNCEAETGKGNVSAPKIQAFSVKFSPDCNEGADCAQWQPDMCPQSGKKERSCNKTKDCNYQTSKQCAYYIPESNFSSTEQPIQTLGPDVAGNKKPDNKQEGGANIFLVFLVIVAMAGGAFAFIKIKSKKKPKKEKDIFGEDEFEDTEGEEERPEEDSGEEK